MSYPVPDRTDTEPQQEICPECDYPYDGEKCNHCAEWCESELIAIEVRKVIDKPEELKEVIQDFVEHKQAQEILVKLNQSFPNASEIIITMNSGVSYTSKKDKNGK